MFPLVTASSGATAQTIQIIGALLVLGAFAGSQYGIFQVFSRAYLVMNVLGAGTLAVLAALDRQYGFLLLEGVWAVVSICSLVRVLRGRSPAGKTPGVSRPSSVART